MSKPRQHHRGVFERDRGSGVWWIRYVDQHGRLHREKVGAYSLAVKAYNARKGEVATGKFLGVRRREVLVRDAIADRLKRRASAASVRDMKRYAAFWTDRIGNLTLRQVAAGDVERAKAEREKAVGPQSVRHGLAFLNAVFVQAIRDRLCEHNPVVEIGKPKLPKGLVRYLSAEEETALLDRLPSRYHPLVIVALHTGLRQGEQFALKWEHVDLAAKVLTIPRSKSGRTRHVELNETVLAVLRRLPRHLRSPYVFTGPGGRKRLNARNFFTRWYKPALEAARIQGANWHTLRHTFASRLVMKGIDLATVKELLGHSSITMTMRYAHLAPGHRHAAVRALNGDSIDTATDTGKTAEAKK